MTRAEAGAGCATRRATGRMGSAVPSASPQGQRLTHGCLVGGHFPTQTTTKSCMCQLVGGSTKRFGFFSGL